MSDTNRFGQEVVGVQSYIYSQDVQELLEGKEVDEIGFDRIEMTVTFKDGSVLQVFPSEGGLEVQAGTPDD